MREGEGRQTRRWIHKRSLGLTLLLAVAAGISIYASAVEPYWFEVTHHTVAVPIDDPIKIAHLTDIHTSGMGSRERKMLAIVQSERPDLVVITGDSINITSDYPGFREVLEQLHAPLGVWVVRGNHEDWWPVTNERQFYESAGAEVLVNSSAEVREGIWLIGFDDLYGGSPRVDESFDGVPASAYKIALFHSPAFLEEVAGRCDLAIAGHSHGGQVKVPLLGPLWTPPFVGEYVEGWFEKRGTRMYVSRGVGTSVIDVRFWCRPEIAFITVGARLR